MFLPGGAEESFAEAALHLIVHPAQAAGVSLSHFFIGGTEKIDELGRAGIQCALGLFVRRDDEIGKFAQRGVFVRVKVFGFVVGAGGREISLRRRPDARV